MAFDSPGSVPRACSEMGWTLVLKALLYRFGFLEAAGRRILFHFPKLKSRLKRMAAPSPEGARPSFDAAGWAAYQKAVLDAVADSDIVLVHSSMDGFRPVGVGAEEVFQFLVSLADRGCTVVCAAFPITNLSIRDGKMKAYNPARTPCWTGMLSNYFLSHEGVVRSAVPYNSLAAIGPHAARMMQDNLEASTVYGEHTPWKYCVDHHAKLLFLGTTSLQANTIQTHMLADVMGDRWPIADWYEEIDCPVKTGGTLIPKTLKIQRTFWTQFVTDYETTGRLLHNGLLHTGEVAGCPFEYVDDVHEMVRFLEAECEKGRLMYAIPRRYWKKNWKRNMQAR